MTPETIDALCAEIIERYEQWEAEAGQAAQVAQDSRVYSEEMMNHLRDSVRRHIGLPAQPPIPVSAWVCQKCGGQMMHTRLKGYRCTRCD